MHQFNSRIWLAFWNSLPKYMGNTVSKAFACYRLARPVFLKIIIMLSYPLQTFAIGIRKFAIYEHSRRDTFPLYHFNWVVDQWGLEPQTFRLWVCCSNQLSYKSRNCILYIVIVLKYIPKMYEYSQSCMIGKLLVVYVSFVYNNCTQLVSPVSYLNEFVHKLLQHIFHV